MNFVCPSHFLLNADPALQFASQLMECRAIPVFLRDAEMLS